MKQPVDGKELHVFVQAALGSGGIRLGELRADDDVPQHPRAGQGLRGAGHQLINGEAHHVGGAGLVHPVFVQGGDPVDIHQRYSEFGIGVDVHCRVDMTGEVAERVQVDRRAGVVVDRDTRQGHSWRLASYRS